jgi:hypothetical protein
MKSLSQTLAVLWASPYTLAGLLLGVLGLCTGGRARVRAPVVEFYGGGIKWLILRFPDGQFVLALAVNWSPLSLLSGTLDSALATARRRYVLAPTELAQWSE